MKKYRFYIITIIVLGIVALVLYRNDKSSTLDVDNKVFAVTDTSSITRIRISGGGESVVLERQGANWTVNQMYNARPKVIKALLGVISSLEISTPVSKSITPNVLNAFANNAVTVSIEASGQVLKSYRVTENDSLYAGSFCMMTNDPTPYIVRIAGYDGRVSKLFPVNPMVWRNKTVFQNSPAGILSVEVVYPNNPAASFGYYFMGKDGLKIKSLKSNKIISIGKEAAANYLMNFASVPYHIPQTVGGIPSYGSLMAQSPFCQISLKDAENQIKTVKLFKIPDTLKKGAFDLNNMYAVVQDDTIPVIVKYIDFDPIMKQFDDFYTK